MFTSPTSFCGALKARLPVFVAMFSVIVTVLIFGYSLVAAALSCLTKAGAFDVGGQLTTSLTASPARVSAVLLVVVLVIMLICLPYPWTVAVGVMLGAAVLTTELARRLTSPSYQLSLRY